MRWTETLYERTLRRPIDEQVRREIDEEYARRRHQIPLPTELRWHQSKPEFVISSRLLSFIGRYTTERLVVDAELTLAAKMLATDEHRRTAVRLLDDIADSLGL
jgi:hypothetical protein